MQGIGEGAKFAWWQTPPGSQRKCPVLCGSAQGKWDEDVRGRGNGVHKVRETWKSQRMQEPVHCYGWVTHKAQVGGNQQMTLERQTEVRCLQGSRSRKTLWPVSCRKEVRAQIRSRDQRVGCDLKLSESALHIFLTSRTYLYTLLILWWIHESKTCHIRDGSECIALKG